MVIKRVLLTIPVILLFVGTGIVFLAAHAPRTWSSHWSQPSRIVAAAGQNEYGAVRRGSRRWDLLWVDDANQKLVFTSETNGKSISTTVDRGDVIEPSLIRQYGRELGVWINNRNGSTDLQEAVFSPSGRPRTVRIRNESGPIEHPYLFAGNGGRIGLIYSSQLHGNFDDYLAWLNPATGQHSTPVRLTHSVSYSFYPRAVTDSTGNIDVIHLDLCCQQRFWNVNFDRYAPSGRHLGRTFQLYELVGFQNASIPGQWGEQLEVDSRGFIWGAFTGDGGIWVFKADRRGRIVSKPHLADTQQGLPLGVALAVSRSGGYLFWEQSYDLGTFLDSRRIAASGVPTGPTERAVYESGSQTNPHADASGRTVEVVWQTITRGLGTGFEQAQYRTKVQPTLAERLGLGIGNPWEEVAILTVGSVGVAAITTTVNILIVLALALVGIVLVWALRRLPGRWTVYTCVLSALLFALFVSPGGPILFLSTLPELGLRAEPFGILAACGALVFMWWMGTIAMRRIEDAYRAGIMAFLGVFFFAFVESVIFVQQHLAFI